MYVLKEIKTVIFRGFSRIEIAGVKKQPVQLKRCQKAQESYLSTIYFSRMHVI